MKPTMSTFRQGHALRSYFYFATTCFALQTVALAQSSPQFTVSGAERSGNADGRIPKSPERTDQPLPGWKPGASREQFSLYAKEIPLQIIAQNNVNQFEKMLSPGAIALLKSKPGYTMPVYPTHRSCGLPALVAENTLRFQGKAHIARNGWSIEDATLPSIPFPHPRTGSEALWNFLVQYQGLGVEWSNGKSYLSPRSSDADPITYSWHARTYYPWAEGKSVPVGDMKAATTISYRSPAAMSGQAVLQRFYFDKPAESYYYFPGQRRMRRMANYAYDAPLIGFEKTYPSDAGSVFNGNPDRFEWVLKGKRELYVPYNALNITDKDAQGESIFGNKFISAKVRRYELHRVWVIEGNLRPGMRHSTPHKVIYLDEDSWSAVAGEDYDADGAIVRYKEAAAIPIWELGSCSSLFTFTLYDFVQDRYVRDGYISDERELKVFSKATAPWLRSESFSPEAITAQGN
jgi:hypothetical protein